MKAMKLETALRKLIESGDTNKIYGHAGAFQQLLGDEKCEEFANLLNEILGIKMQKDSDDDA